jgi:hypothetical protein
MTTLFKAVLETKNFTFEATDFTENFAKAALLVGLVAHSKQYKIPVDWYVEFIDNIQLTEIKTGYCYRDNEMLS